VVEGALRNEVHGMDQGQGAGVRAPTADTGARVGHRTARLGRAVALFAGMAFLLLSVVVTMSLVTQRPTADRVTVTMPCARVDTSSVGRPAYGLDQVLSAGCVMSSPRP